MVEAHVETYVVAQAEAAGWFVRKLKWQGQDGAQDRFFLKDGRHVFIEFKDLGEPERPLQAANRKEMEAQGAECYVIDNISEGMKVLGLDAPKTHTRRRSGRRSTVRASVR